MDYINTDYKNWYLKCRLEWQILEHVNMHQEKLLIISYTNQYLTGYLDTLTDLYYKLKETIIAEDISDGYSIIVIMTELSADVRYHIDNKSSIYGYQVWDLYAKYIKYELTKTPKNYIIDEFNTLNYKKYTDNKDRLAVGYIKKTIAQQYSNNKNKLFNKVEIETISRCNNTCSFCPVNKNNDIRPFALMDEALFKNIINQLVDLKYDSCIALFSNNEPLLDQRLISFAKYTRQKLPNNFIYIYTNGLLLTRQRMNELIKYFDHIYINNYNTKKELNAPIHDIWIYLQEKQIDYKKVTIHMRDINETLSSRAGTAPNRNDHYSVRSSCLLPFNQLSIRANGEVSLCSIDALCQRVMGNLNQGKIAEIWNSDKYNCVRTSLIKGRDNILPCKNCDMLFTTIPYEKAR